ncbi:MAG: hypothetical protein K8H88_14535 [Sandaracinaceae bacterium]|nr:hypothetical protein [Sandaracinaceae bacterium]
MHRYLLFGFLATGCYASHAPGLGEAGVCTGSAPIDVLSIDCPASVRAGESATVVVLHRGPFCCAASEPSVRVAAAGPGIEVLADWDPCACCAEGGNCPCDRVIEWRSVLDTGPILSGPFVVRAGDQQCRVEVGGDACTNAGAGELSAPRYARAGDPVPVLLTSGASGGCGCTPRASSPQPDRVALELCECSNEDPCVDPGYQATVALTMSEGVHEVTLLAGSPSTSVEVSARCTGPVSDVRVTEVQWLAPDPGLVQDAERATWIRVRGVELRCCLDPAIATSFARPAPGQREHDVPLFDCAPEPCDCAMGMPRDFELDVHLGALEPGTHTVRIAGTALELVVP